MNSNKKIKIIKDKKKLPVDLKNDIHKRTNTYNYVNNKEGKLGRYENFFLKFKYLPILQ